MLQNSKHSSIIMASQERDGIRADKYLGNKKARTEIGKIHISTDRTSTSYYWQKGYNSEAC